MKRSLLVLCLLFLLLVMAGIPLAGASPTVSGVSPVSAPQGSTLRVTITGSGFNSASTAWMYKCALVSGTPGSQRKFPGSIQSFTSNQIVADFTFDSNYKVGEYAVAVNTPNGATGTDDWGYKENIFSVYSSSSGTPRTTTTTGTTETITTTTTSPGGENSVFFQTEPSGATIYLDGTEIGTSTFTYYTNRDGVHDVTIKKIGFEDYEAKVTILEGKRVNFYAPLTIQSSSGTPSATKTTTGKTVTTTAGGTPAKNITTTRKSTLQIPTPLGTDPPLTEESPVDPATALWAAALGLMVIAIRRR